MEKAMCYGAIGLSALMAIIFLMDMAAGTPFGGGEAFAPVDFFGLVASGIVVYLGINALREVK